MREESIVQGVLKYLKGVPYCYARKHHGSAMGRAGQPDISGCLRGMRFELEVKKPGLSPTRIQEIEMARWAEAGAFVRCVHSVDEARDAINELEKMLHA